MTSLSTGSLRSVFRGELLSRDDERYDGFRQVFNGMIDRHPAVIARCTSAADVAAALGFAREVGLPVAVYGGGHGVTGNAVCDGGLVVDLRPMKGIRVDPVTRTCRAAAGLTWGEFDAATARHGLAVTGGRVSTTGVAGLVLGSGSGWLERKYGYSADNLLSVEVVTAAGQIVTASQTENPELFWGTRGGGGNFGVVTSFEFALHPLGTEMLGGMLLYRAPMAAAVLARFREFMAGAPDEVGGAVALITAPPAGFVPEPLRGQPVVGVVACYAGPPEEGGEVLRPLREFGPPDLDLIRPLPYVAMQRLIDEANPKGLRNYWSAGFLASLPDEAVGLLCGHHLRMPSPHSQILVIPGGGALARIPEDAMAFGQRKAPFNVHILSMWEEPADDAAGIAWARHLGGLLKPFTTGRTYLNFIGDEGEERVKAAFGPRAYARLQALKDRYDPQNLFRLNQNIRPAGAVRSGAG
jgi:FAD/FMN-containing dehydrogenase